ncbi:hypothetical protein NM688_g8870 [Phlebia brevispora]|uniref:Uncharacterized protein n=1 Tax=Phlebia brevispora TaxID=194682 RepID=A0ACC1RQM3_9APHY|nr:hypothetical protein NM688_g8870 [Phlebia brevispora]
MRVADNITLALALSSPSSAITSDNETALSNSSLRTLPSANYTTFSGLQPLASQNSTGNASERASDNKSEHTKNPLESMPHRTVAGEEDTADGALPESATESWSPFDIRILQTALAGYLYYNRIRGPRTVAANPYRPLYYADLRSGCHRDAQSKLREFVCGSEALRLKVS